MLDSRTRSPSGPGTRQCRGLTLLLLLLLCAIPARAAWFDNTWTFRRPLDVRWDPEKATGDDLAVAEFYTAGHHKPTGDDIRIAADDGKPVAFRLLKVGPGDFVRVLFALKKGEKRYYAYFGHPSPPALPANLTDLPVRAGLLLEMRRWTGGPLNNFTDVENAWERGRPAVGATVIDRPSYGLNPFGDLQQTISKVTGSLFAPIEGDYTFAASADDRGALYLDGKGVLFVPGAPGDTRFSARAPLTRGRHDFLFYHVNTAGDGRFTVVWKRPDQQQTGVILPESFGFVRASQAGPLEEYKKTLTADFRTDYLGECFVANNYSHRVKFTSASAKAIEAMKYEWDFGDGQAATSADAEHVYLTDGVYPVRLTVRVGPNHDTQTCNVSVTRQYERLDRPQTDDPAAHSRIVATYAVARMPLAWLPRAVPLHLRARQLPAALPVMQRLAAEKASPDPRLAVDVLVEGTRDAWAHNQGEAAMKVWDAVPAGSSLNPLAAYQHGQFLLWWAGDVGKALRVLEPFARANDNLKRLYAQALILNGKATEGAKLLEELPAQGPPERRAALSGALARTTEYYITEGDWEAGEEQWDRWQTRHPTEFVEGYSILLKTKLMELRKAPVAAAKIAEAFAAAVPDSSYAPQLIDRASKLLEKSDAAKSESLRQLLKQRYPEDPLSQDEQK